MTNTMSDNIINQGDWLDSVKSKLAGYEAEYQCLKESTTLLELALWKMKINDNDNKNSYGQNKKLKIDESNRRSQCRVGCGADVVIRHVISYLLPVAIESIIE